MTTVEILMNIELGVGFLQLSFFLSLIALTAYTSRPGVVIDLQWFQILRIIPILISNIEDNSNSNQVKYYLQNI